MFRTLLVALTLLALPLSASAQPVVKLWRIDCGAIQEDDLDLYSDTYAYVGQSKRLVVSCYLIQHGSTYMLWDVGLQDDRLGRPLSGPGAIGESMARRLPDSLAQIGVKPEQISLIGISHYHQDHTGQAGHFPQARLLLGKGDVEALKLGDPDRVRPLAHWFGGGGALEPVEGDKDVFGDASVVMLDLPGHTPGHHGLLIKLAHTGYVLLSGDVSHFRENLETSGIPRFNTDRSQSLASLDRFKAIAKNLHALVVIQHDARDVDLLPTFPKFAD
jgi:glyoxylase-like metal-dependent hydrolase (beta-lactamase superfamily II)